MTAGIGAFLDAAPAGAAQRDRAGCARVPTMIFLVHVPFTEDSIEGEVGLADYSYYFVMQAYLPVLQALGKVVEIEDPLQEADEWYRSCAARGEYCVLLCFAPPHRVPRASSARSCRCSPGSTTAFPTRPGATGARPTG